jgi:hypothetical protein
MTAQIHDEVPFNGDEYAIAGIYGVGVSRWRGRISPVSDTSGGGDRV